MSSTIRSVLPNPTRSLITVYPDVLIRSAIDLMAEENIGALAVFDEVNYLGILSERDIIRQVLLQTLDPNKALVSDAMCSDIMILDVKEPIETAMSVISQTRRRHILVSENSNVIAILSIGDLLFNLLEERAQTIEHLENYIHTY